MMKFHLNSVSKTKLLLACLCIIFLAWLLTDSSPRKHRRLKLEEALRNGQIGGLTIEEEKELLRTLNWLAAAAEVREGVTLNVPPSPRHLNVYTVTPAAIEVTYCDQGNAVYDAELNAIFIDQELVKAEGLRAIYEASPVSSVLSMNDLPFWKVYLCFIFLHELGHHKLHQHSGGFFDLRAGDREDIALDKKREEQADQFAIDRALIAYQMDLQNGGSLIPESTGGGFISLESEATPSDRAWVDLAGSIWLIGMMSPFLPSPYAPFYEDEGHTNFIERARGLIKQALKQPQLDRRIRAYFIFFDRFLTRQAEILQSPVTEVLAPEPIDDLNFDGAGLLIVTKMKKSLFNVSYQQLISNFSAGTPIGFRIDPATAITGTGIGKAWSSKLQMWSSQTNGTIRLESGEVYKSQNDYWHKQETSLSHLLGDHSLSKLAVPPQPSEIAIIETYREGKDWLHSLWNDQVKSSRLKQEIVTEVVAYGGPMKCELELASVTSEFTFFTIFDSGKTDRELWGIAVVDTTSLRSLRVTSLNIPLDKRYLGTSKGFVIAPDGEVVRYILIASLPHDYDHHRWQAWEVFTTTPPKLITEQPFLLEGIEEGADPTLLRDFDPIIENVAFVPPQQVLVKCQGDSTYVLDLKSKTSRVLFHPDPGDEAMKWTRIAQNGLVAIFMRGGHKCYVIQTRMRK